jgi:predicted lipoprotein with Yx(FWY)xxD motif
MKQKKQNFIIAASAIILIFLSTSCKKNNAADGSAPAGSAFNVQLTTNTKFGNIMTDGAGKSLYFFSLDGNGDSACTGPCLITWPVFYKENPSLGTGLDPKDFGTITRSADNAKQTTYKGWPLYYYMPDTKAGDVNGDAVGSVWFVAKADYTVMLANAQLVGADGINYNDQGVAGTAVSQYITDPSGRTLYNFAKDTFKKNNFTLSDFSNDAIWPVYTADKVLSVPSILDKSQFDVITVFGKTQVSYKGRPLYYFGQDAAKRGNTKGVSFPTAGAGIWKINNLNTAALVAAQ